jgi:hypothetical protein
MTTRRLLFYLVDSVVLSLAVAGIADANTGPRAFVSTDGSDTNPCSAVQPCRSFNQALTVLDPGGELVVQNSGGYSTGFTITKSVTIDGGGLDASVFSTANTDLCTISAGPNDRVVMRGLTFHGQNLGKNAINVAQAGSLYLEHCSITEFTNDGVMMLGGGSLFVTGSDLRQCFNGLEVATTGATSANLVAQDSRFTECSTGVFLKTSGTGAATGSLTGCTASRGGDGVLLESSSSGNADITLTNCGATGNSGVGLEAQTSSSGNATIRITGCVVTQNSNGIVATAFGGGAASVLGTSPATNLVTANSSGNSTSGGSVTLQ